MCLRAPSSWAAAQLPPAELGDGFPLVPLLPLDKDSTSSPRHSGPCLLCKFGSVLRVFILQPSGQFEHPSYLSTLALRTTCHPIIEMETKESFTFGLQFPWNHHRLSDREIVGVGDRSGVMQMALLIEGIRNGVTIARIVGSQDSY